MRWGAAAVVLAGILWWARGPLQAAMLPYEDGTCLFQRHFQELSAAAWFGTWNGYVSLLPNLLASLLCQLPVAWVPHAFVVTGCLLNLITFCVVLSPRYAAVAPLSTRAVIAALWAWVPLGDWMQLTSLMYSLDPLLLWLVLELLRPAGRVRRLLDPVIVVLLTWSHPLSIALVPVSAWRLREPAMRPVAITHLVASTLFFLFGCVGPSSADVTRIVHAPEFLAVRIGFESFCGTMTKLNLNSAGSGWVPFAAGGAILVAVAAGALLAWRRWGKETRLFVLGLVWMMLASAAAAMVMRNAPIEDQWGHYHWIGRVALAAIVCLVATTWVPAWCVLLAGAVWAWHLAGMDWRHGDWKRPPELSAFLDRVAAQEAELGGRRALDVTFDRPGLPDWGIKLTPK